MNAPQKQFFRNRWLVLTAMALLVAGGGCMSMPPEEIAHHDRLYKLWKLRENGALSEADYQSLVSDERRRKPLW